MKSWPPFEEEPVGIVGYLLLFLAGSLVGLLLLALLAIEVQYRRRPGNKLAVKLGEWQTQQDSFQHYQISGTIEFTNQTRRLEIMVPEISAEVQLLSAASLAGVTIETRVMPLAADAEIRPDGYWEAYIIKRKPLPVKILIDLRGDDLSPLKAAWVKLHYVKYGPAGRIPQTYHLVVPLKFPEPTDSSNWRTTEQAEVLPIRTHLLTPLDNPVAVVQRYVQPHAKPGDIVTIGESPIAIMQGRFRHPSDIKPGWVAQRLCYLFLPTSSLATACGLQSLVDIVGPLRVLFAFLAGALAKAVLRKPGVFYQLAGEQARLIDDVTGTLPPYDQFLVMGPDHSQAVVDEIKRATGLSAAIVDVNDLRRVKVLAASHDIPSGLLENALISNPAGNANEQTPVVLIRPL